MVLAAISSVVREIRCKWLIQITVKKLGSFPQPTYRTGHIHVRRRRLEFNKNPSKGLIFSSKFFSVSIRATEKKRIKTFRIFPFYYYVSDGACGATGRHPFAIFAWQMTNLLLWGCRALYMRVQIADDQSVVGRLAGWSPPPPPLDVRVLSRETGNKMFVTLLAFPLMFAFSGPSTCRYFSRCLYIHFIS